MFSPVFPFQCQNRCFHEPCVLTETLTRDRRHTFVVNDITKGCFQFQCVHFQEGSAQCATPRFAGMRLSPISARGWFAMGVPLPVVVTGTVPLKGGQQQQQ